jgi:hypothetical protein
MGIITKLFGPLELEHRTELAAMARPRRQLPNTNQDLRPYMGRIMASKRRLATRNMDELLGMAHAISVHNAVQGVAEYTATQGRTLR